MIRKDLTPKQTIANIKKILKDLKIPVLIYKNNYYGKFYSVRICLKANRKIGTNGKGNSYKQALASGLAEFLERLQAGIIIPNRFLIETKSEYFPTQSFNEDSFYEENKTYLNSLVEKNYLTKEIFNPSNLNNFLLEGTNYLNHNANQNELLPYRLIKRLTHSNGLCAGNSKFEALSQGICEIFERYTYKTIVINNLTVKQINRDDLKKTSSFKLINFLEQQGYDVQILDLSLNGTFPVLAVLVKHNNKYAIAAGSDIDFDITLKRCLNELFQGLNNKTFSSKLKENKLKEINTFSNWLTFFTSNNGEFNLNNISNETVRIVDLPFKSVKTNEQSFNELFKIITKNSLTLYYQNLSFINFHTYHVFIPTLSEIDIIDENDLKVINTSTLLTNFYLNPIQIYTEEESIKIINSLIILCNKNKYVNVISPAKFLKVIDYINSDIIKYDFKFLLMLAIVKFKKLTHYEDEILNIFSKQQLDVLMQYNNNFNKLIKNFKLSKIKVNTNFNKKWNKYYTILKQNANNFYLRN